MPIAVVQIFVVTGSNAASTAIGDDERMRYERLVSAILRTYGDKQKHGIAHTFPKRPINLPTKISVLEASLAQILVHNEEQQLSFGFVGEFP